MGSQIFPQRLILRNSGDMSVSDVVKTVDETPQSGENVNYDSLFSKFLVMEVLDLQKRKVAVMFYFVY